MKARILSNNLHGGNYTTDFLDKYKEKLINGQLVKDWILTEVLPNENLLKPFWNGTKWIEGATPEEIAEFNKAEVPQNIRSRQLRLALVYSEFSLDNISQAIEQLEEPQKSVAKIEWEYATSFDRDNQLLISLGYMLGLTEEQIDNLFILADTL